jgi:ParB-like nuclease domain
VRQGQLIVQRRDIAACDDGLEGAVMPIKKRVWGPANRKRKTWVLDYYDQVGKLRHKAFKNRRDAERFSEKTQVRIGQLTTVVVAMNMGKDKRSPIRIRISDIAPWRCAYPPAARRYAAMLRAGLKLPPIDVARLGPNHYEIMDGMHRARAAKLAAAQGH